MNRATWKEQPPAIGSGLISTLSIVLEIFGRTDADHALFGGLVAACHGRFRLTWDVDVLAPAAAMEAAARDLEAEGFIVTRFAHLIKFHDPVGGRAGGDLLSCQANRVLAAAFAGRTSATVLGLPTAIVSRAAFVALKFEAAATTARAPRDRARDVADIQAVLQREFKAEDEADARRIVALMHPGAEADLTAFMQEIRQGRFPQLARRAARRPRLLIARAVSQRRRTGR